jgi:predicted ester cyclase
MIVVANYSSYLHPLHIIGRKVEISEFVIFAFSHKRIFEHIFVIKEIFDRPPFMRKFIGVAINGIW